MSDEQAPLFDISPDWKRNWAGMPAYEHQDLESWGAVKVHFRCREDRAAFAALLGQQIPQTTKETASIWYPPAEIGRYADKAYRTQGAIDPRYPIYIVSKGRWESRRTSKALEAIGVPYFIVVEPQEFDQYAGVIAVEKVLRLPFSNLGQGSIPARNWIWEHARQAGAARHWILDDNISGFFRFQNNLKCPVESGVPFRAIEDFCDRYTNVAMAGMNYFMFVTRKSGTVPALTMNTRIYSCILLRNDLSHRWRGRYNEDTDLSLRILKDGYCTVLFNAFLADKEQTMLMRGGNTETLYLADGRLKMAESLRDQHPDVVTITRKWGRWQHQVDYKPFRRNQLVRDLRVPIEDGVNDYGMSLTYKTIAGTNGGEK